MRTAACVVVAFAAMTILSRCDVPPASQGESEAFAPATEVAGKSYSEIVRFAGTGNYYQAVELTEEERMTWSEARSEAAGRDRIRGCTPHLATVTSQEENDFIVETFPTAFYAGYWLGGVQPDGNPNDDAWRDRGWAWVTGEPFDYANWAAAEPNDSPYEELALVFAGPWWSDEYGSWNDLPDIEIKPSGGLERIDQPGYVVEWTCRPMTGHVTGSGHFDYAGEYRTFAFTAIGTPDGNAKGEWQVNNRATEDRVHGDVECVVVRGNEAWFAGTTTQASNEGEIGVVRGFRVVDSGEDGPPDLVSLAYPVPFSSVPGVQTAAGWCAYATDVGLYPILEGDVVTH